MEDYIHSIEAKLTTKLTELKEKKLKILSRPEESTFLSDEPREIPEDLKVKEQAVLQQIDKVALWLVYRSMKDTRDKIHELRSRLEEKIAGQNVGSSEAARLNEILSLIRDGPLDSLMVNMKQSIL